jgi:hypothetical protein
LVILQN